MAGELAEAETINNAAVCVLAVPDMEEVARALKNAQREIRSELRGLESMTEYEAHRARAMYVQLDRSARKLGKRAAKAMGKQIGSDGTAAGRAATKGIARMVRAGEAEFAGAVAPLRLDVAAVLAQSRRSMIGRWERKAHAYGHDVEREVRRSLMTGIIRGETIDQMTSRVMRGSGMIRRLQGDPTAQLDAIVARPFDRARSTAQRLVRTEVVNAYNTVAVDQIHEMNHDDPGWYTKWDAANDRRVCPICRGLDRELAAPGDMFPGGYDHPPAHPCCRCAAVAWRMEWGKP